MTNKKTIYITLIMILGIMPLSALAQGLIHVPAPAGTATGNLFEVVIGLIDILLTLVGFLAVIMIIFGGFRFIVSAGDPDAAAAAKNTVLYAIIGLIVVGLSAAIVNFVIGVIQTV